MELWIRSQDKELLLKIDVITVDAVIEDDGEYDVRYHNIVLGRYENKKRALEVLDEIQKLLMPQEYEVQTNYNTFINTTNISSYVYEMPKE